jgi:Tfp pilus assembly protein PilF
MPEPTNMAGQHDVRLQAVQRALQAGDTASAVSLARAALSDGVVHPLLLNLRALAFEREGREQEALSDLLQARELAPQDPAILNALGLAFARQNRLLEAVSAFEAAVAAKPDFAHAHFNVGWVLEALGELDKARRSYKAALALDPARAEILGRLASLAARRGDWSAVRDFAGRALAINQDQNDARLALATADIGEGRFADAEAALKNMLSGGRANADERYHAFGSLGDLYHRQSRFADAYAAYVQGNREMHRAAATRFAPGRTMRPVIGWLDHYFRKPEPWPQTMAARAHANREPAKHIFLLGFPRSGTTLLEQILAGLPGAVSLDEKEALADSARAFLAAPEGLDRLRNLDTASVQHYRATYWQRVREFGATPEGRIFIDKHPLHTLKLPLIARLFPEAKIIFAIRDPRDVVLSCIRRRFRMNAYTYEFLLPDSAASFYSAYMGVAALFREKLPLAVTDIRNEDLIADFDSETRRLCAFIGVDWDTKMRNFTTRAQHRAIATPGATQIMRGLNADSVGLWRHYAAELAPIMAPLAPWVKAFGYPPA